MCNFLHIIHQLEIYIIKNKPYGSYKFVQHYLFKRDYDRMITSAEITIGQGWHKGDCERGARLSLQLLRFFNSIF